MKGLLMFDVNWHGELSAKARHEICSSSHFNLITKKTAPVRFGQEWMQTQHLSEISWEKAQGGLPLALYKRERWWIYYVLATPEAPTSFHCHPSCRPRWAPHANDTLVWPSPYHKQPCSPSAPSSQKKAWPICLQHTQIGLRPV